jgi:hypothetical protein
MRLLGLSFDTHSLQPPERPTTTAYLLPLPFQLSSSHIPTEEECAGDTREGERDAEEKI